MPSKQHDNVCDHDHSGILLARDIFNDYVELVSTQFFSNTHISIGPGESIFSTGETPAQIYLIRAGQALLLHKNGKCIKIDAVEGAEPVFGLLESLSGTSFEFDLNTVTECGISVFKAGDLFEQIRRSSGLSFRLAEAIAGLYIQTLRSAREI